MYVWNVRGFASACRYRQLKSTLLQQYPFNYGKSFTDLLENNIIIGFSLGVLLLDIGVGQRQRQVEKKTVPPPCIADLLLFCFGPSNASHPLPSGKPASPTPLRPPVDVFVVAETTKNVIF